MAGKSGLIFDKSNSLVNQILPHKNRWAFDLYLTGCQNNWNPQSIPMGEDIAQWKGNRLTADEMLLVKRCLGFFAGSESLVSSNLLMNVFADVTDAECRQFILRQAFEESLHNLTVVYVCDSLDLDIDEVYGAYATIPSIRAKDEYLMSIITNQGEDRTDADKLATVVQYFLLCEGLFFYCGFAMILALGRKSALPGLTQQIAYTMKDEANHVAFGTKLILTIRDQNPHLWNDEFKANVVSWFKKGCELELDYVREVLPRGILGLNQDSFMGYIHYIANRRLTSIGLPELFPGAQNPLDWMSEILDLQKLSNFFERHSDQYVVNDVFEEF